MLQRRENPTSQTNGRRGSIPKYPTFDLNQPTLDAWRKVGPHPCELKEKLLKKIELSKGECISYFVKTKIAIWPIKIRIFTDYQKTEIEMAFSFQEVPDRIRHNEIKFGKNLLITKKWEEFDVNKRFFVTVFAWTKFSGHIGTAFKGIQLHNRAELEERIVIEDLNKLVRDLANDVDSGNDYLYWLKTGREKSEDEKEEGYAQARRASKVLRRDEGLMNLGTG
jgi:hypothetical protein